MALEHMFDYSLPTNERQRGFTEEEKHTNFPEFNPYVARFAAILLFLSCFL